jgi:peroxiredoxin
MRLLKKSFASAVDVKDSLFNSVACNLSDHPTTMKTAAVILFLCCFAWFSVALKTELRREKSPIAALKIGETMPDFEIPDSSGKSAKLSELIRGKKVVLINFWASWCGPCRLEMPTFEKLFAAQKNNGFIILAISEDKEREKLDQYLKEKPVSFPVLIDKDNSLSNKFKIEALPTTVLLDGNGKITQVREGVQPYLEYIIQAQLRNPEKQ